MEPSVEAPKHEADSSRATIIQTAFCAVALISLGYALVTAPKMGGDLRFFQEGAREWVDGLFQIGEGVIGAYTPFLLPLLSPIAPLSFQTLVLVWIGLNIAATVLSLHFVNRLWGEQWPIRARVLLAALLIAFAPFRVTLRNGQISLMVMALLLGALLARKRNKNILAGALLGISLCKYTLSFPFFLYFVWRREWKIVSTAILLPLVLTEVFALRLGMSLFQVVSQYGTISTQFLVSGLPGRTGTTEIKLLFLDLTNGNDFISAILTLSLSIAALICMGIVFSRKPRWEMAHFSAVSLFSLWSIYHRTYDSVLCLLPAALFVDLLVRKRLVRFSRFGLAALGLLIVSIPGVLVDRLKMSPADLTNNPFLRLGVHVERLLVFGMFCSLMVLIWRARDAGDTLSSEGADNDCETLLADGPESPQARHSREVRRGALDHAGKWACILQRGLYLIGRLTGGVARQ